MVAYHWHHRQIDSVQLKSKTNWWRTSGLLNKFVAYIWDPIGPIWPYEWIAFEIRNKWWRTTITAIPQKLVAYNWNPLHFWSNVITFSFMFFFSRSVRHVQARSARCDGRLGSFSFERFSVRPPQICVYGILNKCMAYQHNYKHVGSV